MVHLLLPDLESRKRAEEPLRQRDVTQELGEPATGRDHHPLGVDRAPVGRQDSVTGRAAPLLDAGDVPPGLKHRAGPDGQPHHAQHGAFGVEHAGSRLPQHRPVERDAAEALRRVGRSQELVLDTHPVEHPGEVVGGAIRPLVDGPDRIDERLTGLALEPGPVGAGPHDEPRVELVGVGVAEDAGRAVRRAELVRGLVLLEQDDLVALGGEAPGGRGPGEACSDDDDAG